MSIQEQYLTEIANAIRQKGATTSQLMAKDFAQAILNIPSGGAGGVSYLSIAVDLFEGENTFVIHSDTEFASSISVSCFNVSKNVKEITKIDALNIQVLLANQAILNEEVTISANKEAYLNSNGISNLLKIKCKSYKLDYLIDHPEDMIEVSFASNEGTQSISLDMNYPYNNTMYTSAIISGNSFIQIGPVCIYLNNRNNYISKYYYRYILIDSIKACKIRWEGWAPYSSRNDTHKYIWEVFLFETGDVFLVLISKGATTTFTGTFKMFGQSYTISLDQPYVSFYRQNKEGTDWNIAYSKFNIQLSKKFYPLIVPNKKADAGVLFYNIVPEQVVAISKKTDVHRATATATQKLDIVNTNKALSVKKVINTVNAMTLLTDMLFKSSATVTLP